MNTEKKYRTDFLSSLSSRCFVILLFYALFFGNAGYLFSNIFTYFNPPVNPPGNPPVNPPGNPPGQGGVNNNSLGVSISVPVNNNQGSGGKDGKAISLSSF